LILASEEKNVFVDDKKGLGGRQKVPSLLSSSIIHLSQIEKNCCICPVFVLPLLGWSRKSSRWAIVSQIFPPFVVEELTHYDQSISGSNSSDHRRIVMRESKQVYLVFPARIQCYATQNPAQYNTRSSWHGHNPQSLDVPP